MHREQIAIGRRQVSYLVNDASSAHAHPRSSRTIVFLHAFPLQASMWETTLGSAPEGWRAIAPDLEGFGQTPLADSLAGGMTDMAGGVIDLLDRLEITESAVVGCSMGGYVLFEMFRIAPRYVSAIGLVSTRAGADTEAGRAARQKMIGQLEREGIDAVASQMVPKLLGADSQQHRPDLVEHLRNLIVANSAAGAAAAVKGMMERKDSTPLLADIRVPTLIVAGADDTLIPPSEGQAMHQAIPTSRLEVMALAGHLPNLEHPAAFDATLWQFFERS